MDFLKNAVASAMASGPPFPYNFGDKVDIDESVFTLHNGTRREDGSNCSIFSFDITTAKGRLPLARNALKKLRTMRHPGVIKVLDTVETETYIYIATERVVPLRWHVRRKSLAPETIKWGLHGIARTIKFINTDASSIHGNLKVGSVYTSESGEWKLGGFEVLSNVKNDETAIYTYGSLVPDAARYTPPEIAQGGWEVIKKNPHSAMDSFDFGVLIFEVFNGDYNGSDQAGQTKNVPPSMQSSYKRLCNASPKARISVSVFLDQGNRSGSFFDSPLIKLTEGIDNLGVKAPAEREQFLDDLDQLTDDFPEEFFKMKILPELIKSVEFGGGGPKALAVILKIAAKLSNDDFEARIIPFIVKMFGNPDRAIRVYLLDSLPLMIDRLPQKIVNDKLFPNIATGFTDMQPVVREQTLKSVLLLITKLSDRTINGELLRQLAKTANDEQPGIRTNTTICLGKIAKYLGTSSRTKVLMAAFTRSLRDPFVHARNAALMALAATNEHFTEEDCAARILPVVCPLLIDKEKMIRDQASRTVDSYLQKVRKAASAMPDTALPPQQATDGQPARMGTPQQSGSAGWTGWAISSFTNKLSTAAGDMKTANGSGTSTPKPSPSPGPEARRLPNSSASALHRQAVSSPPPHTSGTSSPNASAVAEAFFQDDGFEDGGDAWGEMDDNDDVIQPASISTNKPLAKPSPFEDDDEPDFAGWLEAQAQKKKPGSSKPLPKGLSKSTAAKKPATKLSAAKSGAKPAVAKKIDIKPKETEDDDGWGDGW
ncbi:Nuclear aminoacylation-dependent tRNA export pathway component [Conoideocrella luteorostrata]|uniref:Nuclear aminoacylation-dependent tRNA export pathway component n=1 Tax=Conoideocrella luteorostrata TaxID=1105319 RepID=A0AAJ0CJG2_9HYPO|nr:Nuclear aminoacylation-dependent tRNA export pathway component [Conoideocrella luteorostrata]